MQPDLSLFHLDMFYLPVGPSFQHKTYRSSLHSRRKMPRELRMPQEQQIYISVDRRVLTEYRVQYLTRQVHRVEMVM